MIPTVIHDRQVGTDDDPPARGGATVKPCAAPWLQHAYSFGARPARLPNIADAIGAKKFVGAADEIDIAKASQPACVHHLVGLGGATERLDRFRARDAPVESTHNREGLDQFWIAGVQNFNAPQ